MIYPSGDILDEIVASKYSLVMLAAKRARQVREDAPHLIQTASPNPLTIALEEIAAGKIWPISPDEEEPKIAGSPSKG